MEINQQLQQRQIQTITAEQLFSLNILQMTVMELEAEISRELEENPILEVSEVQGDANDEKEHVGEPDKKESSAHTDQDNDFTDKFSHKELTQMWEDNSYRNVDFSVNSDADVKFDFSIDEKTLKQYLHDQLRDLKIDRKCAEICDYIIESINRQGYLHYNVADIAADLGVSIAEVTEALYIVQDFHPDGIAAQNLKECLQIQLKKRNIDSVTLRFIVDECLDLLADNKIKHIAKKAAIQIDEAVTYCNIIKSLSPYPSKGFYTGESDNFIVPDAYIVETADEVTVSINERSVPCLMISNFCKNILKTSKDTAELDYIRERINKANFLIKSIEQRKSTLMSILELITEYQWEYLKTGRNLKPMTLKNLSEKLGIHESTISRAIRGKYILAPTGQVYLKSLFSSKLERCEDGTELSSADAKIEIKKLIQNEDSRTPLSDQQICDALNARGLIISRRTVTKYREAMNIGSSTKRKIYG